MEITPAQFTLDGKVSYAIEEIEKGREFQVSFTSVSSPPQSYRGFLKIKTNYPEKPEFNIRIRGRIMQKKPQSGTPEPKIKNESLKVPQ